MTVKATIALPVLVLVLVLAIALAVPVKRQKRQSLSTDFDPAKVETFLRNDDFVKSQINCVLANDDTRCSPIGRRIRKFIQDGLAANGTCPGECTQEEKDAISKVLKHVKSKFNSEWNEIAIKYNVPTEVLTKLEAL